MANRGSDPDDEDALFLAAMHDFNVRPSPGSPKPPAADDDELFFEAMAHFHVDSETIAHAKDRHAKQSAAESGLQRLKAAKKPIDEIDETLDLHGFTVEQAMHGLSRFVAAARGRGGRRVLVITGKGHHSEDGVGKVKQATEEWIRRFGRRSIESYSPAPRAQGGGGAFVLVLRKP